MDFNIIMFIVFGLLAIAGGIVLFISKHPIRGALGLLGSMLCLAGMYAILNAHAIAAFQVIIYAGAVMVLITYIIMLLDIKSKDFIDPFSHHFYFGIPIVAILLIILLIKIINIDFSTLVTQTNAAKDSAEYGTITALGKNLLSNYLFSFEYVSTLLFAAIIAVIAIVQLDWKGRK